MQKLNDIKCFLLDMDGTFYLGNRLLDGALDFLKILEKQNKQFYFLTNNSSKSSKDYQIKLKNLGVNVPLENIINSGQVTANYIKQKNKKANIYLVGTPSLEREFREAGLNIIKEPAHNIDTLVLGFDTTLTYEKLMAAHILIKQGVNYIATNPDYVCPVDGGNIPDCGSIISLLKTSTGKEPLVIGKPNILMIDYIVKNKGIDKNNIGMIGDRLYTDIQTAINASITGILVLSGETRKKDLVNSPQKPDYIFAGIKELGNHLR